MRTRLIICLNLYLLPAFSLAEQAALFQDHASIQNSVVHLVESKLRHKYPKFQVEAKSLDRRLKLQRCESPLTTFFPQKHFDIGAVTVGVRCESPKPWLIFARAQVRAFSPAVVTRNPMKKGMLISKQDIRVTEIELKRTQRRFYSDPKDVIGKQIKRSVAAGGVLTANNLSVPNAVNRGDQVIILADNHGMHIRMTGSALRDGIPGQKIRVKNISSKRIVEGTVVGPGVVQVNY